MCTSILQRTGVSGSARGASGWFAVNEAVVTYDHPSHAALEHAINIDLVHGPERLDLRVGAELTIPAARDLALAILAAVERAEAYEAG
jgi:hypothetical protein